MHERIKDQSTHPKDKTLNSLIFTTIYFRNICEAWWVEACIY